MSQNRRLLNKRESEELFRVGGVPAQNRDRFIGGIEASVAIYLRLKDQKSAEEVEAELKQIKKRVDRCLALPDYATWRPGEFRKLLKAISSALANLSPPAQSHLAYRNVKLSREVPRDWSPLVISDVVIDPICFSDLADQLAALRDLSGALAGPVAKRRRGRPRVDPKRILYHNLAVRFNRDTGKAATNVRFLDVCEAIGRIFELEGFDAETLERLIAGSRAKEV